MPSMAETIDGRARELLTGGHHGVLSTVREDGTVHGVVVWVDADDAGNVLLNSAEGRDWPANLRRTGHATLTVPNKENPYEFVSVTGRLADDTHDGADEHIDALAKRYLGKDEYPFRTPDEQRVIFRLTPERVVLRG